MGSLAVALLDAQRATEPGAPARERSGWSTVDDDRIRAFVAGEYRQVVATVELVCGSLAILRLGAWVTTVALNLARSQMRRWRCERRARERLAPLQRSVPDAPAASGEAHAVREALRDLPRRQREVTALRYYLGLDVGEIADALGIAEGTVKAMLFRARQSLAVALDDEPPARARPPVERKVQQ